MEKESHYHHELISREQIEALRKCSREELKRNGKLFVRWVDKLIDSVDNPDAPIIREAKRDGH